MTELDINWVRDQFPAFGQSQLTGQGFFENAGGSYTCKPVIDRLYRYYTQRKVQPYAAYEASRLAGEEMDEARAGLAAMFGVDHDELSFGPSTTQNTYVLSQAFAQMLAPNDAIIVTNQDHEANTGPWRRLAERGFEIREWKIDPETGHLDLDDLEDLLADGRVKLLCFPHCSNVVGEINDVKAIAQKAHDAGAVCCVDGVSYAPHGFVNVSEIGADIYLFSAYKTYGPHQGIMIIRRTLGEKLPNQGHYFNADSLYKRFTPAGPDHAQVAACAGMVDYFNAMAAHHNITGTAPEKTTRLHDLMRQHEIKLMTPLLDFLRQKNSLRMLGPDDPTKRAPTIALYSQRNAENLAGELAKHNIMAGGGDFYANRALEAQGVNLDHGVLRISFTHYTSAAEINQLTNALDQLSLD